MATGTLKNKLADKLRLEDPEQFLTLVRMHLSFVLDLNTDDYECAEKNKFRPSKWVFGKKTKCLTKGVMEGAPLTQEGICQAYQLIEYLTKESSICQEGLFRRTGKLTRQQELKALLNKGVSLDLDNGNFSVHDCASVLKSFLAELPEPLLTDAHYPIYCQIAEFCGPASNSGQSESNELRLLHSLQLLLLLLPAENRILLQDVLKLLNLTASYESCNKMSAENLSTLFTPHLLCPRKLTPEAFHANSQAMSGIVAFMIHKGDLLFEIPPKLSTDIQVYWAERERRKVSGRRKLGSNICEGPPANTVFTFVDRERSAQENSSNPTEVALAQLYAHIQSLPESSKKRKLIKQFNKENGQGTPLQESYRQKHHHRSKSLGDSIKRHIFNKGVKRHKSSNHSNVFGPLRSVSQEVLNETMMTPRSRKPVVVLSGSNICHLSNVSTWQKHAANLWENHYKEKGILDKVRENPLDEKAVRSINVLSTKSISSHDTSSSHSSIVNEDVCQNISHANCCGSGDSLTSTFKSYLMSRSVLTASPVDLSFSSRTGDFDTSLSHERCLSTDALSDSLLYCLDGNEPSCSSQSLSSGEKFKESPELQENLCTQDCSSIIDCNNEPNINNAKRFLAVDSIPSNEVGMKSHLAPVHETSL
ncbi:hypothetical protein R5R35_007978 [Gryllus longicercus]|uniref:Rho-GAP domain-containing protein n=1 Tax=Gryllus longicercus TaxID=2509291 RepID=A0AAN9YWE3_9ORTH